MGGGSMSHKRVMLTRRAANRPTGNPKTQYDLWVLALSGEKKSTPYLNSEFSESEPRLSRDSRWLAYTSDESGKDEIYVQSFPKPGTKASFIEP